MEQQRSTATGGKTEEIERIVFHPDMLQVWNAVSHIVEGWNANEKVYWGTGARCSMTEFAAILCAKGGQRFISKEDQQDAINRRDTILEHLANLRTRIASDPLGERMVFHGEIVVKDWKDINPVAHWRHDGIPPGINPAAESAAAFSLDGLLTEIESMFSSELYPPFVQNPSRYTPDNKSPTAQAQILYGQLTDWVKWYGADWEDNGPLPFSSPPLPWPCRNRGERCAATQGHKPYQLDEAVQPQEINMRTFPNNRAYKMSHT